MRALLVEPNAPLQAVSQMFRWHRCSLSLVRSMASMSRPARRRICNQRIVADRHRKIQIMLPIGYTLAARQKSIPIGLVFGFWHVPAQTPTLLGIGDEVIKIGYVRVSTAEQNTARQEELMKELGVEHLYVDKTSGKNADRPKLKKMLTYARRGDTVIVESISRFARNTRDLLDLVEQLTSKHVEFVSRKEAIDTTTPSGKFMLTGFWRSGRTGARVHFAAPAGGYRDCQAPGKVHWAKTGYAPGF